MVHTVHIESEVDNLEFRCQSKDDDLGNVVRNAGEDYDIKFCLNVWKSTLYFCHFYWEGKQQVFDVFSHGALSDKICFGRVHGFKNDCYWSVREDGFYIPKSNIDSPYPLDWLKKPQDGARQLQEASTFQSGTHSPQLSTLAHLSLSEPLPQDISSILSQI
ncbi:hypothetical protein OSB04_010243 [Centaurea solstitialis]|uniref:S-protein homolog n=1 Tax=Centaurea solstitialis TaxID=347529 RepID=A0AA38T767_9ASTR|nr:hypothetical protein OSB04_010243 [Centaurea solstitialis]